MLFTRKQNELMLGGHAVSQFARLLTATLIAEMVGTRSEAFAFACLMPVTVRGTSAFFDR